MQALMLTFIYYYYVEDIQYEFQKSANIRNADKNASKLRKFLI